MIKLQGPALPGIAAVVVSLTALQDPAPLVDAPGRELAVRLCGTCHDPAKHITKHRKRAEEWASVVTDMQNRGMRAEVRELEALVEYLAKHYGPSGTSAGSPRADPVASAAVPALRVPIARRADTPRDPNGPSDWLTWGGDAERTGWNPNERALSKQTVGRLALKWRAAVDLDVPMTIESGAAMLTTPVVAQGIKTAAGIKTLVYTHAAASNTLVALDLATGAIVWKAAFANTRDPLTPANWLCTNTTTATPAIDKSKGLIYTIAADGRLHALDLATGRPRMDPTPFVPPYSRNWSLNLVDGVLYTTVGRGCGTPTEDAAPPAALAAAALGSGPGRGDTAGAAGGTGASSEAGRADAAAIGGGGERGAGGRRSAVASHMIAMDLNDPKRPIFRQFSSGSRPSGAWTRSGMAWGYDSLFALTADGAWDPVKGLWGQTLLRLKPRTLDVLDYFTPSNVNELNEKDLDYSSGGVVAFTFADRPLVFSAGKDGVAYLHDAEWLGGPDHRTPLFALKVGNDELSYAAAGVWGSPATNVGRNGDRWIYLPMWGPASTAARFGRTNGEAREGSILALQVTLAAGQPVLVPKWQSRNLAVPESPVVANGVVYALSTGENTIQRHTDPRYHAIYQKPGAPPLPKLGTMTAEERRQNTTHATLYALDAETGEELYSSRALISDWTHLSSITVAAGTVFVTTREAYLYAFAVK